MPQPHVHIFYRIWFTWVDPIVIGCTVFGCIFTPNDALEMLVPGPLPPVDALQSALLHQAAALFGFMGIMFGVLLRASSDPKIWRIVQAATLAVDVSLIATMFAGLEKQGRLDTAEWRGIEWLNLGFTVWVALIRVGFLSNLGGQDERKVKKSV